MNLLFTDMSDTYESINYSVFIFDPSLVSETLSNEKKEETKKCRFCGRILDESHYKKDAHAISASLGNTKFFCSDECDECNENFGRTLENDVTQFFQVHLLLNQVPKRNGKERHVSGRNFEMQMSNENITIRLIDRLISRCRCRHIFIWAFENLDAICRSFTAYLPHLNLILRKILKHNSP